jgi:DNA repair protein RadD
MAVFCEGTDLPRATVCLLARAFTHASLFLQCVGRVLRPSPGKGRALLIDLIGSVHDMGLPDEERIWSLDGEPHRLADTAMALKQCDVCGAVYRPGPPACPICGAKAEPPPPPKIDPRPLEDLTARLRPVLQPNATPAARAKKLKEWVDIARERNYKNGWIKQRYHAVYGRWPSASEIEEAGH